MQDTKKLGVVLTGGGARGAYQAGALRAVAEVADQIGISNPFPILSGLSAGAINAGFLAAYAHNSLEATGRLVQIWNQLSTDDIFRTGAFSLMRNGVSLLAQALSRGLLTRPGPRGLLDTTPLRALMGRIPMHRIRKQLAQGHLDSIAMTAINYTDGSSKTFFDSREYVDSWVRIRRWAERSELSVDHIMASTAIPFLFPPCHIGDCFFGDGGVRNHAPLSPAIHLGAEKLLVVAVRRKETGPGDEEPSTPSMGRVISVIMNSILLDAIDIDHERLERINDTLSKLPPEAETALRPVDVLMLRPSEDIGYMAYEEAHTMPRSVRYLIGGLGNEKDSSGLISYLLFESSYLQRLSTMGYRDTLARKDEVVHFLRL